MKYRSLILLLLFFFSCEKSDPLSLPTDGEYEGILVLTDQTVANGELSPLWRDTFLIELTLEGDAFRKPGPAWEDGNCEGTVTFEGEQVFFNSSDCDCLCTCLGNFDCRGDFILGWHQYRLTVDSLIMWREDSISRFVQAADLTLETFSREDFSLRRVD